MSKYDPFTRYLEKIQPSTNVQSLSFSEVERILGFKLPKSAYEHRAWWGNPTSPTDHPYAQSWLKVGWKVDSVDQLERRVHFRRTHSTLIGKGSLPGSNPSTSSKLQGISLPDHKDKIGIKTTNDNLSEDNVKRFLEKWLVGEGWQVQVAWGHIPGVDIEARQGARRWVIEVKGSGSLQPMRVNYFLGVLGELLQHMVDPDASYSIALPDMQQFRRLWERLPALVKQRTGISALFVDKNGNVVHL